MQYMFVNLLTYNYHNYYDRVRYCDERDCVSVRSHISKITVQTSPIFMHVDCGRGSVLL